MVDRPVRVRWVGVSGAVADHEGEVVVFSAGIVEGDAREGRRRVAEALCTHARAQSTYG